MTLNPCRVCARLIPELTPALENWGRNQSCGLAALAGRETAPPFLFQRPSCTARDLYSRHLGIPAHALERRLVQLRPANDRNSGERIEPDVDAVGLFPSRS